MRNVDGLIQSYSPDIQVLVREARRRVGEVLPGLHEQADSTAPVIAYSRGPGYRGMVCTLILSKSGVKLGLVRGAELTDRWDLLQGDGKVHRHVQLRTPADLKRAGVSQLLKAADKACRERLQPRAPRVRGVRL